jgi:hypothetical protein
VYINLLEKDDDLGGPATQAQDENTKGEKGNSEAVTAGTGQCWEYIVTSWLSPGALSL